MIGNRGDDLAVDVLGIGQPAEALLLGGNLHRAIEADLWHRSFCPCGRDGFDKRLGTGGDARPVVLRQGVLGDQR